MSTNEKRVNVFNDEGRILQVEYAIKNVSNAGTIIGIVCTDGVLLIGIRKSPGGIGHEKIYKIADGIYCAVSGLFSDCLRVVKKARIKAHEVYEEFETACPLSTLARTMGEMKQRLTQLGGARPFGVAMLYIGEEEGRYVIFSTDPSGTVSEWHGKCYGENEDAINGMMKKEFSEKMYSLKETTEKIFHILASVREFGANETDLIEVLHYTRGSSNYASDDKIRGLLDKVQNEIRSKAAMAK